MQLVVVLRQVVLAVHQLLVVRGTHQHLVLQTLVVVVVLGLQIIQVEVVVVAGLVVLFFDIHCQEQIHSYLPILRHLLFQLESQDVIG
jgi:hypothetical protein